MPTIGPCATILSRGVQTLPNVIKVSSCEIYNNKKAGILVVKTPTIVADDIIIDNADWAIHIPDEAHKKQIVLHEENTISCKSHNGISSIHGNVGGSYGEVNL